MLRKSLLPIALLSLAAPAAAQARADDAYARYELLAPASGSFRVALDVTVSQAGATSYVEPLPAGAAATDVTAIEVMTGTALVVRRRPGAIEVRLSRPVAEGAETRIRLSATYKAAGQYSRHGDAVEFRRTIAAPRNAIVLPASYELTAANLPVQVIEEADGRIAVSFMNLSPAAMPVAIRAREVKPRPASETAAPGAAPLPPAAEAPARDQPLNQIRVSERALQDREIVYFLKQPETHAFSLYHDYTASREGEHQYVNVVRAGSRVSDPSAKILDTGEVLKTRTLTGADVVREKIDIPDRVQPETELVLIPFGPVRKGQSLRLRISETYADPARYDLVDGQLMWHRSFGRPRNDMVLPEGWYLTTSSIPAVVSAEPDGRIRLSFWNPRPDSVDVFVKARRR